MRFALIQFAVNVRQNLSLMLRWNQKRENIPRCMLASTVPSWLCKCLQDFDGDYHYLCYKHSLHSALFDGLID